MQSTNPCNSVLAAPSRLRPGPQPGRRRAVSPREIERLVEEARGLVPMFARPYLGRGVAFEDLVGAGNLGIVEAAYRFDPGRGVKFGTYAGWWIRRSISAALRTASSVVVVPHYSFQQRRRVLDAIASGRASGARAFGVEDLAADSGMSARQVEQAMSFWSGAVSLEAPVSPDDHRRVEDRLARPAEEGPEALVLDRDLARCARAALARLSDRQRLVVTLRFGFGPEGDEPASLADVARTLGLSRERVRQIELTALKAVRRELTAAGWKPTHSPAGRES
jgi:RNA polymerase nonessential primary-like sigma factor